MAEEKYNYTFGNESVSTFVTAFYDAVLLYGLALNETLANGGNQSDGTAIVKAMWNKTFTGITGDVNIDANGDRIADYSLLDMDPNTNEFKVREKRKTEKILRICTTAFARHIVGVRTGVKLIALVVVRGTVTTFSFLFGRRAETNRARRLTERGCFIPL